MSNAVNDSDVQELPEGAPDDPLTGHDYDGIQEYDNPLPGWWKWLFIASIIVAPPYFFFYHNGAEGRSLSDRYDRKLAANLELQFKEIGNLTVDRATLIEYVYKDKWLKVGKVVFKKNCVSCHGKEGQGLVGPNLRDEQYKNVTDIGDILTVLEKGANAGAMPAWKNRLSDNELLLVSSYVASLRGSGTVGGERAPEGRDIPPWPDKPAEQEPQPAEVGATDDRMADAKRADEEAAETKSDSGEQ